ncbi:hypothetical protein BST61_g7121 [Cercospora zeina]
MLVPQRGQQLLCLVSRLLKSSSNDALIGGAGQTELCRSLPPSPFINKRDITLLFSFHAFIAGAVNASHSRRHPLTSKLKRTQ